MNTIKRPVTAQYHTDDKVFKPDDQYRWGILDTNGMAICYCLESTKDAICDALNAPAIDARGLAEWLVKHHPELMSIKFADGLLFPGTLGMLEDAIDSYLVNHGPDRELKGYIIFKEVQP
jgi:hypothetical protein